MNRIIKFSDHQIVLFSPKICLKCKRNLIPNNKTYLIRIILSYEVAEIYLLMLEIIQIHFLISWGWVLHKLAKYLAHSIIHHLNVYIHQNDIHCPKIGSEVNMLDFSIWQNNPLQKSMLVHYCNTSLAEDEPSELFIQKLTDKLGVRDRT